MTSQILLYAGAAIAAFWGIAHLIATRAVVRGFGEISSSNRRVLTMGWILEGVSLVWIGAVVAGVTSIDMLNAVSRAVYLLSAVGLLAFAIVSLFTGFKVKFLPFRLCPFLFAGAAILIVVGGVVR
jgi:hypothetical protein